MKAIVALAALFLATPALAEEAGRKPAAPAKASAAAAREASTGVATGRRQHEPIPLKSKDGKKHFEVTVEGVTARIRYAHGADGPAARVPDGKLLLEGDIEVVVKDGVLIEGADRIGIAPLPSP